MSKTKVFWLSFVLTLAVLVPMYLAVYAYGSATNGAAAAEKAQSGVWVAQATAADAKTVLVMSGSGTAQTAESYTLVRFDALKNKISVASMPPETIVLVSGSPVTLAQAVDSAGPSQAAAALQETLNIPVDNYLFATPAMLWQMAEAFGNVQLRLGNYVSTEALAALGLATPGSETQTLSPRLFAQVLAGDVPRDKLYLLRARGYAAFLTAGQGLLKSTLPATVRANSTKIATNLTAADLYDYERALQFLDRQQPTFHADAMPGAWAGTRYELAQEATAFATEYFT